MASEFRAGAEMQGERPLVGLGSLIWELGAGGAYLWKSALWDTGQTSCSLQNRIPTMSAAPRRQQEAPQRRGGGASLAQPGN